MAKKNPKLVAIGAAGRRKSALTAKPSNRQEDWSVKIARANEARAGAQKARAGKPVSFPMRSVQP